MTFFTKPFVAILLAVLYLTLDSGQSPASSQELNAGRYKTNYGPLILYKGNKQRIAGFYYYKNLPAHLFLQRGHNGRYKGIWVQAISEKKCGTKKNGSPYWGTVDSAFKGGEFIALWNYCKDELVNHKDFQWKGKRQ